MNDIRPDDRDQDPSARLRAQLRVLRRQWWIILICAVGAGIAAYAYADDRPQSYEATARLLLQGTDLGSTVTGLTGQMQTDPEREAATALALADQPLIATRVGQRLRLGLSAEEVQAKVSVAMEGNSRVMAMTATDVRRGLTTQLANAYASEYITFRRDAARAEVQGALESVDEQLEGARASADPTRIAELETRRNQLETLEGLQTGGVQLIQPASGDATPVASTAMRTGILGVLLGLLLGCGLAWLRSRLDNRVNDIEDVTQILGPLPVLATIPTIRGGVNSASLQSEGYRALLTALAFLDPDRTLRSILITSATMGEGKTTTSLNLALTIAERSESVLVLEADLRRRGLSTQLEMLDLPGVSEILAGEGTVEDLAVVVSPGDEADEERAGAVSADGGTATRAATRALGGSIEVVPAGRATTNSHALFTSDRVRRLLDGAAAMADNIIVDGTPLGILNDMLPVAARVDTVVVVVHLRRTRRNDLQRLADRLRDARIDPAGIVVFGVEAGPAYDAYVR